MLPTPLLPSLNTAQSLLKRKEFSPRQVARALDVSESSVKRWCDRGLIPFHHTVGGHRRISLPGLLEFVRQRGQEIPHPEMLGLPPLHGRKQGAPQRARALMLEALLAGDEAAAFRVASDFLATGHRLTTLFDEVMAPCFEEIGNRWECGAAEVYQERRACEVALRIMHQLEPLVTQPPKGAPIAIGGAPEGDPYNLGTTMAELILRSVGYDARSLGDDLPFATLDAAITEHQPKLFWLSCSHLPKPHEFLGQYERLFERHAKSTAFVVGGRALTVELRKAMNYTAFCDTMAHLETIGQRLLPKQPDQQ